MQFFTDRWSIKFEGVHLASTILAYPRQMWMAVVVSKQYNSLSIMHAENIKLICTLRIKYNM